MTSLYTDRQCIDKKHIGHLDADGIVRRTTYDHRERRRRLFEEMIESLGLADPRGFAADQILLRDGVMVVAHLDRRSELAESV
jgi:hypothetical protein